MSKFNKYLNLSSIIYDLTKPVGESVDGDLEFYKKELIPINGKILELGCGNGRLTIALKKYNVDIYGMDLSDSMKTIFYSNLLKNNVIVPYYKEDILNFSCDEKFECIILPNGFINLFNEGEAKMIFEKLYSLLNINGLIYIDLIYPFNFNVGSIFINEYQVNDNIITVENFSKYLNFLEQKSINIIKYYRENKLEELQEMHLHWYCSYQINNILTKSGFSLLSRYFDFNIIYKKKYKTLTVSARREK
ncbi:class I SAM-dependent methyltransferase [Spiroplasma turonicum]|uniref:Methyltransferase n=1 Tax=Spiroplasma turonicum TaxID=216946 RepID=A0A0K1P5M2_9MOLU|nr:class I SAM-dependent methyltransferase [Spiroplasma turonicum]AKU79545.1 methyltransferase [Spiroplasma turonicum]ALX70568.1 methyltransferase [Spiroplasma turonicum]